MRAGRREVLLNSAMGVLGLAWAFAFLHLLTDVAYSMFKQVVSSLGKEVDTRSTAFGPDAIFLRGDGDVSYIQTRMGIKPSLPIDLRGMVTIYKPTDWEVDGLVVESAEHPPLSAYMQAIFPKSGFPLVHDAEQNFGFLHRLDIPSSGLILGGTTYQGYYILRLQLDTHKLRREYIVQCRGFAPADLTQVIAKVDVAPDPSQRKSINDGGKPSQTQVCVQIHVQGCTDAEEGQMCIVVIRIATGRRHQIRAHMRYTNHPSISDARYTAKEIFISGSDATPEISS